MAGIAELSAKRRRGRMIRWLALLVVVGAAGAWLYLNRPWEPKPTVVGVETVVRGPASRVLAVNGRVEPSGQVEISSTVSGRIVSVAVAEGDSVAAGSVLLVIDDMQQRAAVAQVQAQLDAANAQRNKARTDLERAEALQDSVSRKTLDDARLAVETAQNEVDRLVSSLEQARDQLSQYTVRAPFDGTILSRGADPGQVVSSSTSLFLFANLKTLYGEASVDELYASDVRRGLPVAARPAGHSDIIDGSVVYVSPKVDASTGGRLVRTDLPGAGELNLPVGLTVMLNIVVDQREGAITIPRRALLPGDEPAVYLLEDGRAVSRTVQFIEWPSDRLIVTAGLTGGETLILDSRQVRSEGALVAAAGQ